MDITKSEKIKPTAEVQSLLDILFKPDSKDNFIFVGMKSDLEEAYLHGANLQKADLKKVHLKKAHLQNADMVGAYLQKAYMQRVDLQNAFLQGAFLQGAFLQEAKINKKTTMPLNWENVVKKDKNGKTGVIFVDD